MPISILNHIQPLELDAPLEPAVDPNHARANGLSDAVGARQILRPHGAGQSWNASKREITCI